MADDGRPRGQRGAALTNAILDVGVDQQSFEAQATMRFQREDIHPAERRA